MAVLLRDICPKFQHFLKKLERLVSLFFRRIHLILAIPAFDHAPTVKYSPSTCCLEDRLTKWIQLVGSSIKLRSAPLSMSNFAISKCPDLIAT